jgi:hypothetical protein
MLRLLILLALLALIVFGIRQFACSDGSGSTDAGPSDGAISVEGDSEATVAVGEHFTVNGMDLVVTGLMPVQEPTRPRYPMSGGVSPGLSAVEVYYQAFVRAHNTGDTPSRLGPEDFTLAVDGMDLRPVPTLSGPAMRSLLAGATFDLILTYIVPADSQPVMVYTTDSGAVVRVEGVSAPEVFETVTTTLLGQGLVPWRAIGEAEVCV